MNLSVTLNACSVFHKNSQHFVKPQIRVQLIIFSQFVLYFKSTQSKSYLIDEHYKMCTSLSIVANGIVLLNYFDSH
jgi:hypothetical protein